MFGAMREAALGGIESLTKASTKGTGLKISGCQEACFHISVLNRSIVWRRGAQL